MSPLNSNQEFNSFLKGNLSPNVSISDQILAQVHSDLNPNGFFVFAKLLLIHFFTALATLSVCPQFGFRILGEGMGLMKVFMAFGEWGCLVACGLFFVSTSLLVAAFLLRGEELRKIRQNRLLGLGTLVLLSLGFFIMLDAEIILGLTFAWFIGAMIGGILTLEIAWALRFRLNYRNT